MNPRPWFRSNRCTQLACAAALLVGCASAPAAKPSAELEPATLYPMIAGSAWSYDVDTGDGAPVLAITRVHEVTGNLATVQGGEGELHYELRPEGIFRQERGGFLLKSPIRLDATWLSGGGMEARIRRVDAALDVPAGHFQGCVEVEEHGSASGATVVTTYCPNVGPVQVISSMALQLTPGGVEVVAKLRGYQIGAAH